MIIAFLGRKIQFLASFLRRDLPGLHFLHLEISLIRSPPSTRAQGGWRRKDTGARGGMGLCLWRAGGSIGPTAAPAVLGDVEEG